MSMKMKTVSTTVPADVKAELLARVAARDAETMAWLDEASTWRA